MDRYLYKGDYPPANDLELSTNDLLFCLNPCTSCTRNPLQDDCTMECRHMELWRILADRCHEGWTPVDDELPKQDVRALVQLDNGWQQVGYHDGQEWQLLCDEYIQIEDKEGFRKVVAWMKLPEVMPGILEDKEDDK